MIPLELPESTGSSLLFQPVLTKPQTTDSCQERWGGNRSFGQLLETLVIRSISAIRVHPRGQTIEHRVLRRGTALYKPQQKPLDLSPDFLCKGTFQKEMVYAKLEAAAHKCGHLDEDEIGYILTLLIQSFVGEWLS
eukprot:g41614.t1